MTDPTSPEPPADASTGLPAPPTGQPAESTTDQGETGKRPDWLPEKFYSPEMQGLTKAVGATGLTALQPVVTAYTELERKIGSAKSDAVKEYLDEQSKAVPETYAVAAPKIDLPEGVTINEETLAGDPLVAWFQNFAKENRLSQEQFDAALSGYYTTVVGSIPDQKAEFEALGPNAQGRVDAVNSWMGRHLGADEISAMQPLLRSATHVAAMEKLMTAGGIRPAAAGGEPDSRLSLQQIQEKMKDPRYWHPVKRDRAFVEQVTKDFQRLYAGQTVDAAKGQAPR